MGRQRGSGVPGLLRRVRWGNVASLVLLVASAVLIATGGRGSDRAPIRKLEPAERGRPPSEVDRKAPERAKPRRAPEGRRKRRAKPRSGAAAEPGQEREPALSRTEEIEAVDSVEAPAPAPAPADQAAPPAPRSGEFTPDPGP